MTEEVARIHQPDAAISEEALKRAEEMIEREEGVQNKFTGAMAHFIIAVAVVMSLFHLYASYEIVRTEVLRATHVAFVLFLSFLIFPVARRFRHRVYALPRTTRAATLGWLDARSIGYVYVRRPSAQDAWFRADRRFRLLFADSRVAAYATPFGRVR